ncbi:hypothetical protein ULF88_22375 [Halopseudomonas pachastrellae]|nr:hypothetical protein [Halopseudomonas pachastrellae]
MQAHLLLIWGAIALSGVILGTRMACRSSDAAGVAPRYLLIVLSILLFDVILHVLFWPITPRQGAMIVPLFIATLYVIRGAQSRPRYIVLGATLALLCCCAYWFAGSHYWWAGAQLGWDPVGCRLLVAEVLMQSPNDLIHQPVRLKIMAALNTLGSRQWLDFVSLRSIVAPLTAILARILAPWKAPTMYRSKKTLSARKPRTRVCLTRVGVRLLANMWPNCTPS